MRLRPISVDVICEDEEGWGIRLVLPPPPRHSFRLRLLTNKPSNNEIITCSPMHIPITKATFHCEVALNHGVYGYLRIRVR